MQRQQKQGSVFLLKMITSLQYLVRQGLPLRGHDEKSGNYYELLQLRSTDVPGLADWLSRRSNWMSHDIQDEILQIMSHCVLRDVISDINSNRYFSVIVDETTDVSTREQVAMCVRHVDDNLTISEDFIGLYESSETDAATITDVIKDVFLRCGIPLLNCRGQCYDGAANMVGQFTGVAARIASEFPKALFIHCSAHSLNLAVQDCVRAIPCMRDMLDTLHEIAGIVRASAKRLQAFKNIQALTYDGEVFL